MNLLYHSRSFTRFFNITSCGELKSLVLDWGGGVLQEIEVDTEHFDFHRTLHVVDEDVSTSITR